MGEQLPYKELLSILEALIEAWRQDPDNTVITVVVPDWPMDMDGIMVQEVPAEEAS